MSEKEQAEALKLLQAFMSATAGAAGTGFVSVADAVKLRELRARADKFLKLPVGARRAVD